MANPNRDDKGRFAEYEELTPIQLKMIVELIENGGNKREACRKLGVPRSTLYKWIDNEKWNNEYRKACERLYKLNLAKALNKLDKMMDCKDNRTILKAIEDSLKLNNYLNPKVDITENTMQNIKISIVDDNAEDEE